MQPLITLRGITKEYKNQDIPALSSIDLDIHAGEFIAITGLSGSGKSTLLNVLGLLTSADSGTYTIDGENLKDVSARERDILRSHYFGFIFQASHVLGYETVTKNAMLGLRTQNRPLSDRATGAATWINKTGLNHRTNAKGNELSGGERQRLAIARAMATQPSVLLADEPTGNLDSKNAQLVFNHLKDINATGTTVILITHDPTLASQVPRQITLHDGKIIKDTGATHPRPGTTAPRTPTRNTTAEGNTRPWVDDALDALNYISITPIKALTLIFAFMLGVGGLIAAQGLSATASQQVSQTLATAALDDVKATITPSDATTAYDGKNINTLTQEIASYPGAKTVTASRYLSTRDLAPSALPNLPSGFSGTAYAVDSHHFTYLDATVSHPHALWQLDGNHPVAFVGTKAAEELGIGNPNSGNGIIWLAGKPVTVLGLVDDSPRDVTASSNIYTNYSYGLTPEQASQVVESELFIRTEPGYPAPLAEALPLIINPVAPETISVSTVADLRNIQRGVSSNLATLVTGISWLLIFLASLTSATTLYTSVQSRRTEIALRRAIGASKASILRIFLLEGTFVGLAGGIAGASLGTLGIVITSLNLGWTPVMSTGWIWIGLAIGALTGMLSAAYPAYLAAQAQPAEAMRA
ncbi:ATP-binding cassette domain-containing protein [Rothia nasimurium]|uniref:ABC transporter ATP-binding protein/permease n=1 Tax=Rothia nasimurium TaxID=85336 RepID=UPI001F004DC8|nr:ABC transporter ATP-binding protein/permease [Rothia nasimurium]